MKIYSTDDLLSLIIRGKYGGAVSEQFDDTWSGGDIEEQNPNAMEYIRETMESLLDGGFFADSVNEDIKEYLDRLNSVTDDDDEDEDEDMEPEDLSNLNEQKQQILKNFKRFL